MTMPPMSTRPSTFINSVSHGWIISLTVGTYIYKLVFVPLPNYVRATSTTWYSLGVITMMATTIMDSTMTMTNTAITIPRQFFSGGLELVSSCNVDAMVESAVKNNSLVSQDQFWQQYNKQPTFAGETSRSTGARQPMNVTTSWPNMTLLAREDNIWRRNIREAIEIQERHPEIKSITDEELFYMVFSMFLNIEWLVTVWDSQTMTSHLKLINRCISHLDNLPPQEIVAVTLP